MTALWKGAAVLAAALHVFFFFLESVVFLDPRVYVAFGAPDQATAQAMALLAFNQGFYNLFLALGVAIGLTLAPRRREAGEAIALFSCACMFGAGVVLVASAPQAVGGALVQAGPPAVAWGAWWLARRGHTSVDPDRAAEG